MTILKMVEIPTHEPCILLMVMMRCIELCVRQVPRGSSLPLSFCNLEIILKMVEIPTHKTYIFDSHDKMHSLTYLTSALGSTPSPSSYYLEIILKIVEIAIYKPYMFSMVMIRCIHLHVRLVPRGSSSPSHKLY